MIDLNWSRYLWMMPTIFKNVRLTEEKKKKKKKKRKWCKPFSVNKIIDDKYQSLWLCQTCMYINLDPIEQSSSISTIISSGANHHWSIVGMIVEEKESNVSEQY
jgi:hypothetical protein